MMLTKCNYYKGYFVGLTLLVLLLSGCEDKKPTEIALLESTLPDTIDYNLHVKPILSDNCFFCHGPDKNSQKASLNLSNSESAYAKLASSGRKHAIVPGDWSSSELVRRITSDDVNVAMPPVESNRSITDYEKAILIKWIEQGAVYKPHWAYIQPQKTDPPAVRESGWIVNEIDQFVLNNLESKGLTPAPEASREILLRRVTFDLTGLPPTLEELDQFMKDQSPDAYEKTVDRLLASDRYGEKMAISWMDLSRFADTHGYTVDRFRPMWPWRDWVIQSFNENMPYDQFVTWQLAGDLLPNASKEQRLATGFNRNHAQNMEGGIVNEEFRVEYVADRTNTAGTAFLGLTMECARCHDHKFDPISQKDYFSIFAFFNSIDEAGQISWDNATPVPTMLLTDATKDSIIHFLDSEIENAEVELEQVMQNQQESFNAWLKTNKDGYDFDFKSGLEAHFTLDEFEDGTTINAVDPKIKGSVADPVLVPGKSGYAFQSNGDEILGLGQTGVFGRGDPFSIGIWVKIPEDLDNGVIFHKGNGDILYNFRGYYLNIREGKAEILMAHTWPYNSIVKVTEDSMPADDWIHLTMTYDGSSEAEGLRLFLDGREQNLITERDNLYKGILFSANGLIGGQQPGLQLGADFRGKGFTDGLMDEVVVYNRELTPPEVLKLYQTYDDNHPGQTGQELEKSSFAELYFKRFSEPYREQWEHLRQLRQKKFDFVENIPEIMVMDEMDHPRETHLLERGEYNAPGEIVTPDVPESILPFPDTLPDNRLGFARWLFHPDHPLTARVAVNRFWYNYFGRGIHKNLDDFGSQGGFPDNLPLLDWLAMEFMESNWDVKAMQKLIVMSATYRQSSGTSEELEAMDPENILLARGPSQRLSAELIRDGALAASGLMSEKIGGPSVKPYQPDGVWDVVSAHYDEGTGEDLYRRSLYTFWRRTVPPPSMNTFDAPSRSYCTVSRQETNTPLQALVLLNDPQFLEASKVICEKALHHSSQLEDQITYMFRLLTARTPSSRELAILKNLYKNQTEVFRRNPAARDGWIKMGETRYDPALDQISLAAGTVVANTIMNSDAFITKR